MLLQEEFCIGGALIRGEEHVGVGEVDDRGEQRGVLVGEAAGETVEGEAGEGERDPGEEDGRCGPGLRPRRLRGGG